MTDTASVRGLPAPGLPAPSLIERLARHLATRDDRAWGDCLEDAASLLAILKEPDPAMAAAGDAHMWRRMIDTALTGRWTLEEALTGRADDAPPPGSDEEGEIALGPDQVEEGARKRASWVHVHHEGE